MLRSLGEKVVADQVPVITELPEAPDPFDFSSFDSILAGDPELRPERTVASLVEGLQLETEVAARLRGCQRIDEVLDNLCQMITTDPHPARGIKAFVGTAGSGKSTSLIKLITRHVIQSGPQSCAIINCDRYRAGAGDQLERLADLLDVLVLHVGVNLNLNQAIAKVAHRDLVAIDMPGLGMFDQQLTVELNQVSTTDYDISRYLVLPANLRTAVMQMAADRFQVKGNTSCILTRLDECDSLGPALSFLIRGQMPVAFTSDGPHIPEDITAVRGPELVQKALALMERVQLETVAMGHQFAKPAKADLTNLSRSETVSNMLVSV